MSVSHRTANAVAKLIFKLGRLRVTLEKHFGAVSSLRVFPATTASGAVLSNPAGVSFLSAGRDSMLNAWTANGDCISSQTAHRGAATFLSDITSRSMGSSSAGTPAMVSLGADSVLKLWDLKRLKCVAELPSPASAGTATKAVWCGPSLVVRGTSGLVRQYVAAGDTADWSGGRDLGAHGQASSDLISSESVVASASRSGQILRWSVAQ